MKTLSMGKNCHQGKDQSNGKGFHVHKLMKGSEG